MTHLHEYADLDHDTALFDENYAAICGDCGHPVDENGVATGLNPHPCFYCSGEDA